MALKNTKWLAEQLGLSLSTVERLRKEAPESIPPHISINNSIRYDERVVEWWIVKQSTPGIPSFAQWCHQSNTTADKPLIKLVKKIQTETNNESSNQ